MPEDLTLPNLLFQLYNFESNREQLKKVLLYFTFKKIFEVLLCQQSFKLGMFGSQNYLRVVAVINMTNCFKFTSYAHLIYLSHILTQLPTE